MADRSRRDQKSKLDKLAAYKRTREGAKRSWQDEDDNAIYDEVTDDQYKDIVKGRLLKDDFVEDDGVDGYMDNGMDDWGGEPREESEDERQPRKKSSKKKEQSSKAKPKPKAAPPIKPVTMDAYRPSVTADQESSLLDSLLTGLNGASADEYAPRASRKRKVVIDTEPLRTSSSSRTHSSSYRSSHIDTSSDGPSFETSFTTPSDDEIMSPKKKARTGMSDSSDLASSDVDGIANMHVQSDHEPWDDLEDFSSADMMAIDNEMKPKVNGNVKPEPMDHETVLKTSKPVPAVSKMDEKPSWLSVYDSLAVANEDTLGSLPSTTSANVKASNINALEPDGSLRFFWIDYLELDGKIYFIGKLKDKASGAWVSCCVTVENLQRNLFVLPREKKVEEDEDGDIYETDDLVKPEDVYADFDRVRKHVGIKSWRGKFVERQYAFGEADVPKEKTKWLKVVYGFNEPQIKNDVQSPNFSRIFGTNTSAFELLVMKRKIMGPCWLKIQQPHVENKGISWCKFEATVSDPKDINPFLETDAQAPKEIPPLNVMSLSVRTIVNHQENKREIVCVTARTWSNLNIDDPTPPEKLPCTVQTFVRPLVTFPRDFEARAKANGKGNIQPMKNERMLINSLLVSIHKADPDVILGHEFLGVSLDVLLHRMRELKADHWSRIGRFRRQKMPNVGRQGTNLKFLNGRMLCDLTSDAAKGMISSTTWSMTEMCKTHLKSMRQDIDPDDTASYFDGTVSTPDRLMTFVRHCELDAHYQMAIAAKVQILPLTRQLTNLAGNSWSKTLNGGRAERNEYILLHEFHKLKYICPDKTWGKKAVAAAKAQARDEENVDGTKATVTKGKRDKYKGGLVFEPKRGLWDKYILVMDFNSLYPSIIQEYNIDFTTVDHVEGDQEGEEKIPEPPLEGTPQGVLPRLIAKLVSRRREVKKLMKDRSATPGQIMQWDIKQMALKLTANSMYGCLGFEYSRFYARPLAALTTFKGREILTHTKELAEGLQLDVVYGDTDSVFVNSNVTELSEALRIANEFKKIVNDCYNKLEIDLDAIFQRLLLLQKKKYAAIKVEDSTRFVTEIKGLDMKRREYCNLSKDVSQYVLEQILSGEATEVVVENIHEYLTTKGEEVREGKVKLDDFIIFKRLGKNPEDYPDAKSQPHVQVALRLKARGGTARSGDVIPYIFCLAEGEESAKSAQADRAKHPDELRRAGSELKIDYTHYLAHQVLPPIERLCEPIEGTDRARLAECLGLDPSRYRSSSSSDGPELSFAALDSQLSDKDRFKDAAPLLIRCRHCTGTTHWAPIWDRESSILTPAGPMCPSPSCSKPIGEASLQVQLESQIRKDISRYYEGWTICEDQACAHRTRGMKVYGRRCLKDGCKSTVAFEFSDAELYKQLRYYAYLFNAEKAQTAALGTSKDDQVQLKALVSQTSRFLDSMAEIAEKYLDQCGRRWVEMGNLFKFMTI